MLVRKCGAAESRALEPGIFEETAGEISGRIFENRARVRNVARLTCRALRLQFRDARAQRLAIARLQFEVDASDHEARRQVGPPVSEVNFVLVECSRIALDGHAMDERDNFCHFATEGPGVHHEAAADRARNTLTKFEARETVLA